MAVPSYKNIVKSVSVFGGVQCFTLFAALLRSKCVAVLIGREGVGLNALYNSIVTFITNLSGFGLSFSAVKTLSEIHATGDVEHYRNQVSSVRIGALVCAIIGLLLTIISSPFLSHFYSHSWQQAPTFMALGIAVVMTLLSGVELAIMKASGATRALVKTTMVAAFVSVAFTVPFYYLWGIRGVVYAIVCSSFFSAGQTIYWGYRVQPACFQSIGPLMVEMKALYQTLRPMLILGLAYTCSSVFTSLVELSLQSWISTHVSTAFLGLYRAGFQLSITYMGMIFTSLGQDFYPRLSAVNHSIEERNELVRRQIKVSVGMVIPLLIGFQLLAPWVIRLLYTSEFLPVVTMVRWSSCSIVIRALSLPISFLPLAMGKSVHYLILEVVNALFLLTCVLLGYEMGGLQGMGIGLTLSYLLEFLWVWLFCRAHYSFTFLHHKYER